MNHRRAVKSFLPALAIFAAACAGVGRSVDEIAADTTREQRSPVQVARPMRDVLAEFGRMVVANAGDTETFTIEVDVMPNDSGTQKELPADLGNYVQKVISDIGRPFYVVRRLSSTVLLPTGASAVQGIHEVNQVAPDRKLSGGLLGYTAERAVKLGEGRIDWRGRIGGHESDASAQGDNRHTLSTLRVQFSLTDSRGVCRPGDTATYEIAIERKEERCAVSFYLAGSGAGFGGGVIATQDVGNALYDATAACMVQLLGTSLGLPYYRCDPLFDGNPEVEKQFREGLDRLTDTSLDAYLKRYLFLAGHDTITLTSYAMSDADRRVAAAEMAQRGIADRGRNSKIDLIVSLWATLDYRAAADRNDERLSLRAREAAEAAEAVARADAAARTESHEEPPAPAPAPPPAPPTAPGWPGVEGYDWPATEPVIELDLRNVDQRDIVTLLSATQQCAGVEEMRTRGDSRLYGLLFRGRPQDLQQALRRTPGLERFNLVWPDRTWRRLIVVPRR